MEGRGEVEEVRRRGSGSREAFCCLRLWGVRGRSNGKAEAAVFSEEKEGDRLTRLGEESCLELKSRRGKEIRMDPARSGLVDGNKERAFPPGGFGFFWKQVISEKAGVREGVAVSSGAGEDGGLGEKSQGG